MLIGYKALLIPLGWVVIFFIVAFSAWHDWRGERRPIRRWGAVFFLVGALLMSTKVVRQVSFHHELHSLKSSDVAAIRIDGEEMPSEDDRQEVVSALNGSTFLDPHDGGPVRRSVKLEIRMHSGETRGYSVARYHEGASIVSGAKEAFSTDLVSVLDRAGKPLPDWQKH